MLGNKVVSNSFLRHVFNVNIDPVSWEPLTLCHFAALMLFGGLTFWLNYFLFKYLHECSASFIQPIRKQTACFYRSCLKLTPLMTESPIFSMFDVYGLLIAWILQSGGFWFKIDFYQLLATWPWTMLVKPTSLVSKMRIMMPVMKTVMKIN